MFKVLTDYIYLEINIVCCVGRVEIQIDLFFSDEGPMLETLDYTVLSVLAVH